MGIRETLEKNPVLAYGVAGGLILVAVVVTVFTFSGSGGSSISSDKAFFTTDDGQSYYTDSAKLTPPYQKDGKEAVRCYVFKCATGEKVAYMERYTKEAIAAMDQLKGTQNGPPPANMGQIQMAIMTGREIKKPGDKTWSKQTDPMTMQRIMNFKCPDGSQGEPVFP